MSLVAAVDLGTNSFLCLIARQDSNGRIEYLSDEVEVVRLGQDVNKTRQFQPQALDRARKTLRRFRETIDRFGVKKIKAVATSAARDVTNLFELQTICDQLQIPLEVISGEKEAELTFIGVRSGFSPSAKCAVLDIGGGSTEIIVGDQSKVQLANSIDIGAVRVTEMFFSQHPPPKVEIQKAVGFIEDQLKAFFGSQSPLNIDLVIAVAGTPTELVSAKVGGYDPRKIDQYLLKMEELEEYVKNLSNMNIEQRVKVLGISPGRADVILAGTLILWKALLMFKKTHYVVSTRGLRYGLAQELLRGAN
jgi:exopolyphosphatase/guanosine-5'-triphosphate,3'-diphosphate pyrophosphatase